MKRTALISIIALLLASCSKEVSHETKHECGKVVEITPVSILVVFPSGPAILNADSTAYIGKEICK